MSIGLPTPSGCAHDHCGPDVPHCLHCDLPSPLRVEMILLAPDWRHRGGFAFLPPYEGPPRA